MTIIKYSDMKKSVKKEDDSKIVYSFALKLLLGVLIVWLSFISIFLHLGV